jgi:uncharacterized protein with HEPN domain
MRNDDLIRVRHMIDSARQAVSFAKGRTRPDLDHDSMLTLALIRAVEVVGEAASRISEASRKKYPDVPWQEIVGMRNRLIHAYIDINLDILWKTVTTALPTLISDLEKVLGPE